MQPQMWTQKCWNAMPVILDGLTLIGTDGLIPLLTWQNPGQHVTPPAILCICVLEFFLEKKKKAQAGKCWPRWWLGLFWFRNMTPSLLSLHLCYCVHVAACVLKTIHQDMPDLGKFKLAGSHESMFFFFFFFCERQGHASVIVSSQRTQSKGTVICIVHTHSLLPSTYVYYMLYNYTEYF